MLLLLLLLLLLGPAAAHASGPTSCYVVSDAASPSGVRALTGPAPPTGVLATATFDDAYASTGWSLLTVRSNESASLNATLASFAAGFAEGFLTAPQMGDMAANVGAAAPNSKRLQKFLDANAAWMRAQVAALAGGDAYWAHVGAVLAQVEGLAAGQAAAGGALTAAEIYQLQILGGDIFNLAPLYGASAAQLARTPSVARRLAGGGGGGGGARADHCSALVRLTPGAADISVAHTTWSGLENMLRVLKRYDMPLAGVAGAPVPGRWAALSGYPGMPLYSSDDFYVLSSGLVALETTIDNDNKTLAEQFASEHVVLEWLRNVLANRLATDGPSWAATFSRYASGTYTNQWMIVDANKFTPGTPPPPHTLTVVEEMPGHIVVTDRTPELAGASPWGGGSWASYNVVADPRLFELSGQQALVDEYGGAAGAGAYFTYLNTSRANIFRREAPRVVDLATTQRTIRWNEFTTDPLSTLACGSSPPYSATNAISDRSDLNQKRGDYKVPDLGHGDSAGIDAKVTLLSWVKAAALRDGELPLAAQSGPTATASCPAFAFSNASVKVPHRGLNDAWNFPWVVRPFPPVAPPPRAAPVDPLDPTPPLPALRQPAWGPDPLVFGSGMVLASSTPWRGGAVPARVFGAAQPSERVTISGLPPGAVVAPSNPFSAGQDGNWSVTITAPDSNVGVDLTFAGASGSSVVLRDVLFGVTILCSGQSNMDMVIDNCFYANETVAASGAHPDIRYKLRPTGAWTVTGTNEKSLRAFSAVCFYTAWHMKESLPALAKVPIGIVQSSVGGTTIESWMSAQALAASGVVGNPTCGFKGGCSGQAFCGNYAPLIAPLAPFVFKTMLWYQGESNVACNAAANSTGYYAKLLPSLVASWRELFASPFTALVVGLAPTGRTDETPAARTGDAWPALRDSQRAAVQGLAHAAAVWPIDLGDDGKTVYTPPSARHGDLHPRNKTAFGRRLALAYAQLEGVLPPAQLASGPALAAATLEPGAAAVLLTFDAGAANNAGLALAPTTDCATWGRIPPPGNASAHCCQNNSTDPDSPHGFPFEVEGAAGWALAQAEVVAPAQVRLTVARCPRCGAATALTGRVRYAWDAWPLCVLENQQGFPMAPFCSDGGNCSGGGK